MIDTGDERNVTSYLISGTVFSAVFAGSMNYNKYRKNELSQKEMVQDTAKLAVQGGIGTASAVATANYVGNGNYLGALAAIGMGALGVYGAEKISEIVEEKSNQKRSEEK